MEPARSGDRVRAKVVEREGGMVEGILDLGYVSSLDYFQVHVILPDDGGSVSVDPTSVEVLERVVWPVGSAAAGAKIIDLREVAEAGLLPKDPGGTDRTWAELFAELNRLARPLIDAGWVLVGTDRDGDGVFGDSVFFDLEREGEVIELEYYDIEGDLVAWPLDELEDADESNECTFWLVGPDVDACVEAFRHEGWLP